jgi:hypothetical protein
VTTVGLSGLSGGGKARRRMGRASLQPNRRRLRSMTVCCEDRRSPVPVSCRKKKLRRLEITAGAPRYSAKAAGIWSANTAVREAERELARQGEVAYARTVRDWHAAQAAKVGASATPGRASNKPSKGKAARQTTSP